MPPKPEIAIYEEVDAFFGIGAKQVREQLAAIGDVPEIDVRINSPGGNVFDGLAIHNLLALNPAKINVFVDGLAASIASVIAMAGDQIIMAPNALMMIHDPLSFEFGDADAMRSMAELLDKIKASLVDVYATRTGLPREEIARLMAAETWFDAQEAVDQGFATSIGQTLAVAASFDLSRFPSAPDRLRNSGPPSPAKETTMSKDTSAPAPVPATLADLKAACPGASSDFLLGQLDAQATVAQATSQFLAEQRKEIDAQKKRADEAEAKAKAAEEKLNTAGKPQPGVEGVGPGGVGKSAASDSGDATASFQEAFNARIKAGRSRGDAMRATIAEDPERYQRYIDEHNAAHPSTRDQRRKTTPAGK